MIDYYETKSQPITRVMVWQAFKEVRSHKGSGGIDKMSLADLEQIKIKELYSYGIGSPRAATIQRQSNKLQYPRKEEASAS